MLKQTMGRLPPFKVKSDHGVHLGQREGWLFRLDLLRTPPVEEGMDYRIDRNAASGNPLPDQQSRGIHKSGIWTFRRENLSRRTMPNTMPGFCIEGLRRVATVGVDFVRKPFSGSNM